MVDHPFSPTLLQRHVQRAQHQFRVQVARHSPADDAPADMTSRVKRDRFSVFQDAKIS
jgi:hypothetical protein